MRGAQLAADREALQVPGDVLAEVGARLRASPPHHSTSSSAWRRMIAATSPRVGRTRLGPAGERGGQVGEQPGPAEAAAADDHAVAAGLAHHPQRVVGLPDVAVAEDRDVQRVLQRGDRVPVGRRRVALGGRAGVQGDPGDARVLGDAAGVEDR